MKNPTTVEVKIQELKLVHLNDIDITQGDLKDLSTENYEKLKNEILECGFSEPITAYEQDGRYKLLNGTQRVRTLREMKRSGFDIPLIPAAIRAPDTALKNKRVTLGLTSQYGEITEDGLFGFLNEAGLSWEQVKESFRFPEIDFSHFEDNFFNDNNAEQEEAETRCETCNQKIKKGKA